MLALLLWGISFIWGGVLGASSDWVAFYPIWKKIALVLLGLSFFSAFPELYRKLAIIAAGFLWALSHHAPSIGHPRGIYYVRQSGLFSHAYQGMLVANHHQVGLAFGSAETGSSGVLTAKPYAGTLRSSRATFHLLDPPRSPKRWYAAVDSFFRYWQQKMATRLADHTPFVRAWLGAIIFGRIKELAPELLASFKRLGIFHLLVISGMHITFLDRFLRWLLLLPFCLGYSLRLFSPLRWLRVKIVVELLTSAGLIAFVCLIGQPVAAQRSLLLCCGSNFCHLLCGHMPLSLRLLWVFFLQSLLFPIGLVSESAAMSWLAYLLLIYHRETSSWSSRLFEALKKQGIIVLLCGFLWGQLSLCSIGINPVIAPLFTPMLFASLLLLFSFLFPPFFSTLNTGVVTLSLDCISWLDTRINSLCSWQYWEHLPFYLRCLLLVASSICLQRFFQVRTLDPPNAVQRRGAYGQREENKWYARIMARQKRPYRR
jgi:hypothetical protein